MRQTLTELRKSLGDDANVLQADRLNVWLVSGAVICDLNEPMTDTKQEILEGIDIKDQAFEEWLRELRNRQPHDKKPLYALNSPGMQLNIHHDRKNGGIHQVVEHIIADQVSKNLEESLRSWRTSLQPNTAPEGDINVFCNLETEGDKTVVFLKVLQSETEQVLYSSYRYLDGTPDLALSTEFIAGLAHESASQAVRRIPSLFHLDRPEIIATGFANLAIQRLWSFEPLKLNEANKLLQQAYEVDANSVYLAWRAFVLMASVVDRKNTDSQNLIEQSFALTTKALENDRGNVLVQSLVALTRLMLPDGDDVATATAHMTATGNPNNLLAIQTSAIAHSRDGQISKAYRLSSLCQAALPNDETRHLWDLYHCLVCIACGRVAEATSAGRRAAFGSPGFLAPHRQLIGLNASNGNLEGAKKHFNLLATHEPDLTLEQYINDSAYPVTTLRQAGLLSFPPDFLKS